MLAVVCPDRLVVEKGPEINAPPAPPTERDTVFPLTAFPLASLTVIVIVEPLVSPVTVPGDAATADVAALGAPATTVTAAVGVTVTAPAVISAEIDLASALVEV